mgnify:CR=1 FL=1
MNENRSTAMPNKEASSNDAFRMYYTSQVEHCLGAIDLEPSFIHNISCFLLQFKNKDLHSRMHSILEGDNQESSIFYTSFLLGDGLNHSDRVWNKIHISFRIIIEVILLNF